MTLSVPADWWKTLFDDVYLQTDARSVMDDELTRREIDVFVDLLDLAPGQSILDLCAGHGRHSLELARRGFGPVTALDYSRPLLERARAQAETARLPVAFIQADARDLPLADDGFDAVTVLGNSLGYNTGPDSDRTVLQEARRVVRTGGKLLVDVSDGTAVRERFTPHSWHEIGDRLVVCRYRELNHDTIRAREMVICKERGLVRDQTYAIRLYRPEDLAGTVRAAGFTQVQVHADFSPQRQDGDYGFMNHRMVLTAIK